MEFVFQGDFTQKGYTMPRKTCVETLLEKLKPGEIKFLINTKEQNLIKFRIELQPKLWKNMVFL